jgi:CheY-like chemotaxis protein
MDSAENILEALDELQKDEYDVVLLNRPSHEMSEFELLDLLKKLDLLMPAVIGITTRRQPSSAAVENPTLKNLQRIFKQSESPFAPLVL